MSSYWDDLKKLPPEEYARRFRHFPPELLEWAMKSRGLDVDCTDPGTLADAARVHVRYERERDGRSMTRARTD